MQNYNETGFDGVTHTWDIIQYEVRTTNYIGPSVFDLDLELDNKYFLLHCICYDGLKTNKSVIWPTIVCTQTQYQCIVEEDIEGQDVMKHLG